jgi:hypothetical protein
VRALLKAAQSSKLQYEVNPQSSMRAVLKAAEMKTVLKTAV